MHAIPTTECWFSSPVADIPLCRTGARQSAAAAVHLRPLAEQLQPGAAVGGLHHVLANLRLVLDAVRDQFRRLG